MPISNGLVERAEATGAVAQRFALFDYNHDDVVSGAEMARGSVSDVHAPTTTFIDRHTVTLGGKRVTMIHLGTAHADDSSVLHFPDERAVFSADILQVRRLPGGLDADRRGVYRCADDSSTRSISSMR